LPTCPALTLLLVLLLLLLQLDRSIQLLLEAAAVQPLDPNVYFTLATALARKVGCLQHAQQNTELGGWVLLPYNTKLGS
jgi:hypothetical protein